MDIREFIAKRLAEDLSGTETTSDATGEAIEREVVFEADMILEDLEDFIADQEDLTASDMMKYVNEWEARYKSK